METMLPVSPMIVTSDGGGMRIEVPGVLTYQSPPGW